MKKHNKTITKEIKPFWFTFSKRALICFTTMLLLFLSCILRVAVAATSNYGEIQKERNSYKVNISNLRGTIYDYNMKPLTNSKTKLIAAVSPTPKAITALKSAIGKEEFEKYKDTLKSGKPIICEIKEDIKCDGISTTKIYENSENYIPAIHMLGYTDSENNGVTGIEKAYNSILFSDKKVTVYFESNGKGKVLEGAQPIIENDTNIVAGGVVTTLDINIQNITEKAATNIEKGAIVIADAKSGKIRASASMPYFSIESIESYLESDDSPLLNRAISAYNVGSVFKPCVAIAGLENNISNFSYFCTGKHKIIDRYFKCHKISGHNFMNLKTALANSCNTYFYNYAMKIGGDKIYNIASSLNFGNSFDICSGISNNSGTLPKKESLVNLAQLANFSIGQGKVTLSPISILTLYCSIASNGEYYLPSIVEGTLQNGEFKRYETGSPTRVMSPETAKTIREYLCSVLSEGTGEDAKPKTTTAAGKTATAQTGKYKNGTEISQGWFCGFFPAENPRYVVVVFSEDTTAQTKTCNQIFAQIADEITALSD